MIDVLIDQMTIIAFPNDSLFSENIANWNDVAYWMIVEIEDRLHLRQIFGERKLKKGGFLSYSTVFEYGEHDDFKFYVGYHYAFKNSGVIIYFTAQALHYYTQTSKLLPFQVLQKLDSPDYTIRCSRIDVAVDYINEEIDLDSIDKEYGEERLSIYSMKDSSGTFCKMRHSQRTITENGKTQTLYFGARKSEAMLRIYDKRTEQIARVGPYISDASKSDSWIRFELECKHQLAHSLTKNILTIANEAEYKKLLCNIMIQKFFFTYQIGNQEKNAPFTQQLIDVMNGDLEKIYSYRKTENSTLLRNLRHLFFTSGTIPTLYKIYKIWGEEGLENATALIKHSVKNHLANVVSTRFLKNYGMFYRKEYGSFKNYYEKVLKDELSK